MSHTHRWIELIVLWLLIEGCFAMTVFFLALFSGVMLNTEGHSRLLQATMVWQLLLYLVMALFMVDIVFTAVGACSSETYGGLLTLS